MCLVLTWGESPDKDEHVEKVFVGLFWDEWDWCNVYRMKHQCSEGCQQYSKLVLPVFYIVDMSCWGRSETTEEDCKQRKEWKVTHNWHLTIARLGHKYWLV